MVEQGVSGRTSRRLSNRESSQNSDFSDSPKHDGPSSLPSLQFVSPSQTMARVRHEELSAHGKRSLSSLHSVPTIN